MSSNRAVKRIDCSGALDASARSDVVPFEPARVLRSVDRHAQRIAGRHMRHPSAFGARLLMCKHVAP
jgi:hypothetical protein